MRKKGLHTYRLSLLWLPVITVTFRIKVTVNAIKGSSFLIVIHRDWFILLYILKQNLTSIFAGKLKNICTILFYSLERKSSVNTMLEKITILIFEEESMSQGDAWWRSGDWNQNMRSPLMTQISSRKQFEMEIFSKNIWNFDIGYWSDEGSHVLLALFGSFTYTPVGTHEDKSNYNWDRSVFILDFSHLRGNLLSIIIRLHLSKVYFWHYRDAISPSGRKIKCTQCTVEC